MKRSRVLACLAIVATCGVIGIATRRAAAEHFDVLLHVETGAQGAGMQQANAFMDTTPPIGGVNKRPVVRAKANEEIRVKWRMKSAFPHGVMKGVGIHFFVVKEADIGQKPVPDPAGPAGIVDNSLLMDFQPNGVAAGAIRFKLDTPGNYLVRVQSEDTHQEHDHEHFSAIDVQVE
jgi:hypothetical protein